MPFTADELEAMRQADREISAASNKHKTSSYNRDKHTAYQRKYRARNREAYNAYYRDYYRLTKMAACADTQTTARKNISTSILTEEG